VTRTEFDGLLDRCATQRGADYAAARDALRRAGSEVDPWLDERATSTDAHMRMAAEIVRFWRREPDLAADVLELAIVGVAADDPFKPIAGKLSAARRATALASFDRDIVPRLIEIVTKAEPNTAPAVGAAVMALSQLRDPRSVPVLLEAVQGGAPLRPAMALAALGEMRSTDAGDAALNALTTTTTPAGMRSVAAAVLGLLADVRGAPAILAAATNPREDAMVRLSATRALGTLGAAIGSAGVAALAALARGTDERIALAAVEALRGVGDQAALTALRDAASGSANSSVKLAARDVTAPPIA
jgi:HEAT repeat protein